MHLPPHKTIRDLLGERLTAALRQVVAAEGYSGSLPEVLLTPAKQPHFGDLCCAVALPLAKLLGQAPRLLAQRLQAALRDADGLLDKSEIAGPGYLNLFVAPQAWHALLRQIAAQRGQFVRCAQGNGERVLLEYVSANPTGPLHVAHGRGAVLGDALARLLQAAGYHVEREYYLNDMGRQIDVMAQSIFYRYQQRCGAAAAAPPADFYPGDYIQQIAAAWHADVGDSWLHRPAAEWQATLAEMGVRHMLRRIQEDLQAYGVHFDHFVSEKALTGRYDLAQMVERLRLSGHVYAQDGKQWFRSTDLGDDKDRVVLRDDGRPTYFASDIAYHDDKMQRGFTKLINVWGADHAGYLARVQAGLQALGHDPRQLQVIFIQMVSLSRGGTALKMGKRLGTAVWLRDLIDEVGKDAARYFFLMRRADAQMDFDLDLATQKTLDNPVFYAQMGHARLASIARRALEAGVPPPDPATVDLTALQLPEEIGLIKTMARAPDMLADCARALEPHQVVHFIQNLIAQFHSYYSQYKNTARVIGDDPRQTAARLFLCQALQGVLKELMDLLGVEAPERMQLGEATESIDV